MAKKKRHLPIGIDGRIIDQLASLPRKKPNFWVRDPYYPHIPPEYLAAFSGEPYDKDVGPKVNIEDYFRVIEKSEKSFTLEREILNGSIKIRISSDGEEDIPASVLLPALLNFLNAWEYALNDKGVPGLMTLGNFIVKMKKLADEVGVAFNNYLRWEKK